MSFPSKGTKALYRNKIDNVAKFFEDKYSDGEKTSYMIYNLCSEMEYDHDKFNSHVRRYKIDDHNVPTLEQMFKMTDDVRDWLGGGHVDDEAVAVGGDGSAERVVAIHCKGGKGRTGTMICAVLIDMGLFQVNSSSVCKFIAPDTKIFFQDASESLQYFGQRRTDLNVSNQFQGVETYSQVC